MKYHVITASCLVLALAACQKQSQSAGDMTPSSAPASDASAVPTSDAAAASGATAAPAPVAADFVAKAAAGDMYEIAAAKIAQKRSKNADVKALARMMITDHTKSTAMVKKAVKDGGLDIQPPAKLPDDKQQLIDALNSAPDADFDKTYLDQQATAHQDALALMTAYSTSGDNPQLKDAAGKIAPVVQMHIDKITAIQGNLH